MIVAHCKSSSSAITCLHSGNDHCTNVLSYNSIIMYVHVTVGMAAALLLVTLGAGEEAERYATPPQLMFSPLPPSV